jgi:ABC-type uncharacterized transport system substrate-binding protein
MARQLVTRSVISGAQFAVPHNGFHQRGKVSCLGQEWFMRRREFIMLVGGAVAWPLTARAQQPERVRRIGVLMSFADPTTQSYVTGFQGALTKLGWTEGSNLRTEVRWGAGDADKFRLLAKEIVDLRPDAIVGQSTPVVVALVRETQTIPIVFVNVADPIVAVASSQVSRIRAAIRPVS